MRSFAAELRRQGAIASDNVEHAFATVPRHRFVAAGFYYGRQHHSFEDEVPSEEMLDLVYGDNGLFTHRGLDGDPTSSSSQPSLMARMLEALDVRPGMRVLEIGSGTGYNAALIATITGAEVTAVDAGHAAITRAKAPLAELGLAHRVRLEHADGYHGDPAGRTHYDRILVTCGIAGIPPCWLDQLAENGLILAPIAHAGVHPLLAIPRAGSHGDVVRPVDFMPAAGALRPTELFPHDPTRPIPTQQVQHESEAVPTVDPEQYRDLTFYLGVHDSRTTRAVLDDERFAPAAGTTALVDGDNAAWVQQDGTMLRTGSAEALADRLRVLTEDWHRAGRPPATGWQAEFAQHPDLDPPLLMPQQWHLRDRDTA